MKKTFAKKLLTFALLMAMRLSFAAPTAQVKAAGKKTVWVLDSRLSEYGNYKYTYNKNGLLVKNTCSESNGDLPSYEYTYKGTKITKAVSITGENKTEARYTYEKKGYLATQTPGGMTDVTKFKWKNGRCVETTDSLFSYDKNGWIRKADSKAVSTSAWVHTFDKYGSIISMSSKSGGVFDHANSYKNGRLVRQAELDESGEEYPGAYTYKYKKITVPASVVKKVKSQQDWLTNKGGFQYLPLAAF